METYIFLFQFQNANFLPIGLFWAAFMTFDSRGVKRYGDTLMALSHCHKRVLLYKWPFLQAC